MESDTLKTVGDRVKVHDDGCLDEVGNGPQQNTMASHLRDGSLQREKPVTTYATLPLELRVNILQALDQKDIVALNSAYRGCIPELATLVKLIESGVHSVWPELHIFGNVETVAEILKDWWFLYPHEMVYVHRWSKVEELHLIKRDFVHQPGEVTMNRAWVRLQFY